MRLERLRLELRMELAPNEMRMIWQLHHLYVSSIWSRPRDAQPRRDHRLFILAIEFVAMAVAFADLKLAIDLVRQRVRLNLASPRPQPHGAAQFFHAAQLAQLVDHAMGRRGIELARVCLDQSNHVPRKLHAGGLHPQANPEVWHLVLARVTNGDQHSLNATLAKPA